MPKTRAEKEKLILSIFADKRLFESQVLGVHSPKQRIEIIHIFTHKFIRNTLKEELNFLYIRNLADFRFSLIINILFKEFANEWISFAQEELGYSRENSLNEIQNKKRVAFILSIVHEYFKNYKKYFFAEIVDTFFELLERAPTVNKKTPLIESLLESDLVLSGSVAVVPSSSLLWMKVKTAQELRSSNLSKLKVEISEIITSIEFGELDLAQRQKQQTLLNRNEEAVLKLEEMLLYNFSSTLQRLKETMFENMMSMRIS